MRSPQHYQSESNDECIVQIVPKPGKLVFKDNNGENMEADVGVD